MPESPPRELTWVCDAHPREYSLLASAIPLDGDLVLALDPLEAVVEAVRFDDGTARPVARNGSGPLEYRTPSLLLRVAEDTVHVLDLANRRFLAINRLGNAVGTRVLPDDRGDEVALVLGIPRAVDHAGSAYFERVALSGASKEPTRDSMVVIRRGTTGEIDTIARLAGPRGFHRVEVQGNDVRTTVGFPDPFDAADGWAVAADGRLVIVREDPYRVEYVDHSGARFVGDPIPYRRGVVTRSHVAGLADQQVRFSSGNVITNDRGVVTSTREDGSRNPGRVDSAAIGRPLPPFAARGGIWPTPDGGAWILRFSPDTMPSRDLDVIDSQGRRIDRIRLPDRARVLAVERDAVYLSIASADDTQRLSRCELPGSPRR